MIDDFIALLHKGFSGIKEHRRTDNGNILYSIQDCLMAGFAMFSLKDPSLNQFRKNYKERQKNLQRIYKLDSLPSDSTLRETIDGIQPDEIKAHFKPLLDCLKQDDLFKQHKVLGDYIAISNDGTGQFCSCKIK